MGRTSEEINAVINARYDRITILVPKGSTGLIDNLVIETDLFKNKSAYIRALIEADYCGCINWEGYFNHEDYGILLRVADRQKTQPITDYRAKLR